MEQLPDVEEIYVPIGGGGLAAGILIAIKTKNPSVKVIGVESKSFPSMKNSLDSGKLETVDGKFTVADGISVRRPGIQTFEIIKDMIDDIVLVDDEEIIKKFVAHSLSFMSSWNETCNINKFDGHESNSRYA